jgi:tetratricopeptide (TPR) repeat protein
VNRDVPRDLETVVLKAVARDPDHRYATPAELAEDLRRFVDDRPVRARRVGVVEQLWRWRRRNPVVAGLTAALLLVLVAGTAGSAVAAYYFSRLAGAEAKARGDADRASTEIRDKDNELRDQSDRLKRASNLVDSGRLHADAAQYDKSLADYTAALEQRPDVPALWLGRGQFYMQFLCWDEAAADFARGFELQPPVDPHLWLQHAWLRLYVGDRDGYRRVCAAMLDQFGQTTDLGTMGDLAEACTAGPDALDDYSRLIQLLDKPGLDGMHPGIFDSLLSVYWRAGRIEQALRLRAEKGVNSGWGVAETPLVYHALGQDDKARKRLANFNQDLDERLNQVWEVDLTHIPQSSRVKYDLGAYLLCREVVQQLQGLGAVEHPLFWILRSRGRGRSRCGPTTRGPVWNADACSTRRSAGRTPPPTTTRSCGNTPRTATCGSSAGSYTRRRAAGTRRRPTSTAPSNSRSLPTTAPWT